MKTVFIKKLNTFIVFFSKKAIRICWLKKEKDIANILDIVTLELFAFPDDLPTRCGARKREGEERRKHIVNNASYARIVVCHVILRAARAFTHCHLGYSGERDFGYFSMFYIYN